MPGVRWAAFWRLDNFNGLLEDPAEEAGPAPAADDDEALRVSVRVGEPGRRLTVPLGKPWSGDPEEHFYYDRSDRDLLFGMGPRRVSDTMELKGLMES